MKTIIKINLTIVVVFLALGIILPYLLFYLLQILKSLFGLSKDWSAVLLGAFISLVGLLLILSIWIIRSCIAECRDRPSTRLLTIPSATPLARCLSDSSIGIVTIRSVTTVYLKIYLVVNIRRLVRCSIKIILAIQNLYSLSDGSKVTIKDTDIVTFYNEKSTLYYTPLIVLVLIYISGY